MIRTQFNNQPKFAVLELRMGRHMNLFDRRVVLSVVNTVAYTNSVIIADDEVPPGYRVYLWGAILHANTTLNGTAQTILTNNGTSLLSVPLNSVQAAGFLNIFTEASAFVVGQGSSVATGSTVNTGEFADDGYGIMASVAKNGTDVVANSTVTIRVWGCVAPAQLTTAQWLAGAGGAGSGTGGGNDQQIR
jgi:hypothetical protein